MSDLGDIAISKNCQSYPSWHKSIFEDQIFWNTIFKNQFFPKIFKKKYWKKSKKIFSKKNIFLKKTLSKKFFDFFEKMYKWKKYFFLQDFWKFFFRQWNLRKLINGSLDMIIFWPSSKAHNSNMQYLNEIFDTSNDSTH